MVKVQDRRCVMQSYVANEILMHLRSTKNNASNISMQDPLGYDKEGNQVTYEDKLTGEYETIEDEVSLKQQITIMMAAILKCLTKQERNVVEMRYGLNNQDELTQREIAEKMDISRSYVSRIEKKALEKLNKCMIPEEERHTCQ